MTDTVSGKGWRLAKAVLQTYPKFLSVASLASLSLPVMPLMVYTEWNRNVHEEVRRFVSNHELEQVQVRSQSGKLSVGGKAYYHLPIQRIHEVSLQLFGQGAAVVGIQAPGNIYRNDYSVHLDLDWSGLNVRFEIVGPGFTATHLSKHGLMHEQIRLLPTFRKGVERVYRISDESYRRDVIALVNKLGTDQLINNHSLLLSHQKSYQPIPLGRIDYLINELRRIEDAVMQMEFRSSRSIVSMSWIRDGDSTVSRPIFWDIHESPTGTGSELRLGRPPRSGIKKLKADYILERR